MKAPVLFSTLIFVFLAAGVGLAQTTSFTYQGRLTDGSTPANGSYDMQFTLFDAAGGGTQIGSTQTLAGVTVTAGIFTVQLNVDPNNFPGANRFLEIAVRPASGGPFTTLSQRQPISSTPYAVRSLTATTADALSAACVNCVSSSQISSLPAGNSNYIQNTTTQQASSNFSISGNGAAGGTLTGNVVNATNQYNLSGSRLLSSPGTNNLFLGLNAAATGPTGLDNTYVGSSAGSASTTGNANSFFGVSAGFNNSGSANSFFGRSAGLQNTSGSNNSFFGVQAGRDNTSGFDNSFFGHQAGIGNASSNSNSFFGSKAGSNNTAGGFNAFFGHNAGAGNTNGGFNDFFGDGTGVSNTTGFGNTFLGDSAGDTNTTGFFNTVIGFRANTVIDNLTNAAAIGAHATVTANNTMVLGSILGLNSATADTNVSIGTPNSWGRLNVIGGPPWTNGSWQTSVVLDNASAIGWFSNQAGISYGLGHSGGGFYFFRTANNPGFTGSDAVYNLVITDSDRIGMGTLIPDSTLTVNGTTSKPGGGSWANFSDERLKNIKGRYTVGLKAIKQLQPLRYEYKPDNALGLKSEGEHIGFGAQAVARIIPEAVTKDDQGYLLINNDPIIWAAVNAIKEQQAQIETLSSSNATLQARLAVLERELRRVVARSRRRRN